MDYILDDLQWKCLDCGVTAAPTNSDYMKLLKHAPGKKHHVRLVHKKTGGVIASSPKGAVAKGIIVAGGKLKAPQQQGGEMVSVTQPQSGAIIFTIGQHQIPLDPQFLYESFLYYTDLKTRIDYTDSFSAAIRDAMTYIWRKFCYAEAKPQAQG